jgi:hypothetical protein
MSSGCDHPRDCDLRIDRRLGRRDLAAVLRSAEIMERSHRLRSSELMRIIASLASHVGVRRRQQLVEDGVPQRTLRRG